MRGRRGGSANFATVNTISGCVASTATDLEEAYARNMSRSCPELMSLSTQAVDPRSSAPPDPYIARSAIIRQAAAPSDARRRSYQNRHRRLPRCNDQRLGIDNRAP